MGFKDVLKSAMPFISVAAGMGGPLGVMASNMVGKALGVDKVAPTVDGITDAITKAQVADPDAMLKLAEVENSFRLQMNQMGIDSVETMERMANEDRASARAREIAVKDKTPMILAYAVTGGFFTLLGLLCFTEVPVGSQTILNIMVGSLATAWVGIVGYYFGSSSGSAAKTAIMAEKSK